MILNKMIYFKPGQIIQFNSNLYKKLPFGTQGKIVSFGGEFIQDNKSISAWYYVVFDKTNDVKNGWEFSKDVSNNNCEYIIAHKDLMEA